MRNMRVGAGSPSKPWVAPAQTLTSILPPAFAGRHAGVLVLFFEHPEDDAGHSA